MIDKRIEKVLDYIERNLDAALSLEHLASVACLSPSQFHRLFKKTLNTTPFQFIETMKMAQAYQLVVASSNSVYDLAQRYGYKDYETFSRAFKKHHKLSPDDLSAIAMAIRKTGDEKVIVKVVDKEELSNEDIQDFSKTLSSLNISEEDLRQARSYYVNSDTSAIGGKWVKKKFHISQNTKLWQQILNERND